MLRKLIEVSLGRESSHSAARENLRAGVAQTGERKIRNLEVAGSTPAASLKEPIRGVGESQVAERVGAAAKTAGRGVSVAARGAVETDKERMQREFIERRGK